jgi:NADH-quinone oxidoreductase subunit J
MTPMMVLFFFVSITTLGSALMVVTARSLIHMALWLIVVLSGVAVMMAMLSAGFLAVAQVVIYIGAIAILIIFSIMLTKRASQDSDQQRNANWLWGLLVVLVLFAGLLFFLTSWAGFGTLPPELSDRANPLVDLGLALVDPQGYLLPFELASVLLLAALVGAIYVAWERRRG